MSETKTKEPLIRIIKRDRSRVPNGEGIFIDERSDISSEDAE